MLFANAAQALGIAGQRGSGVGENRFEIEEKDREAAEAGEIDISVYATVIHVDRNRHGIILWPDPFDILSIRANSFDCASYSNTT